MRIKRSGLYVSSAGDIVTNEVKTFAEFQLNEELNPKEFFSKLINIFKNINDKLRIKKPTSHYNEIGKMGHILFESVLDQVVASVRNGSVSVENTFTELINNLVMLVNDINSDLRSDNFGIDLNLDPITNLIDGKSTYQVPTQKLLKFLILGNRNLNWPGVIGFLDPNSILSKNYSGGIRNNFSNNSNNFLNKLEKNRGDEKDFVEDYLGDTHTKMAWMLEDELIKINPQDLNRELNDL